MRQALERRGRGVRVRLGIGMILAVAVSLVLTRTGRAQSTGLEVMKTQRKLHHLNDEHAMIAMRLVNKLGNEKLRTLSTYTLALADDRHKILLRFLTPPDIAGTGLLVWEKSEGDDDQWLYLPATRKVRRIPPSSKKNRFMGTDFAYEDMLPEALALHTYTLVGSSMVEGHDTFVIEARPASPAQGRDSGYGLRTLWIRKDSDVTVKIEYRDKAGRLLKVLFPREYVNVLGTAWRPTEIEMHHVQDGSRTIMRVQRRTLNSGLKETFFTELELTRGGT
jgi:Outer membrane lipoprotein-sorting protein